MRYWIHKSGVPWNCKGTTAGWIVEDDKEYLRFLDKDGKPIYPSGFFHQSMMRDFVEQSKPVYELGALEDLPDELRTDEGL